MQLFRTTIDGALRVGLVLRSDGQEVTPSSGRIGALLQSRASAINETLDGLDAVASALVFEMNKLHSTGATASGLSSATATLAVPAADRTLSLNSPANETFAGLPFRAVDGGFTVAVTNSATGVTTRTRIAVDLDGLTDAGLSGFTDDTTLEDVRAALDAVDGIRAQLASDGRLQITAETGSRFTFADDSSGVLGVLGVNAFFAGSTASDIALAPELASDPAKLLHGRYVNGTYVENGTALRIVDLKDQSLAALGGRSVRAAWLDTSGIVSSRTAAAETTSNAAGLVRDSLEAQRAGLSGVSIDEEAINLLTYQRQYQGAARLISITDELLRTVISLT